MNNGNSIKKWLTNLAMVGTVILLALCPVHTLAAQTETQEVVIIEDEDTALAPSIPAEERAKLSWWWLLIIAFVGTAGYAGYRKYQDKIEEDNTDAAM